jgi:hypothetical protein
MKKKPWPTKWDWYWARAANNLACNMAARGSSVEEIVEQIYQNRWLPEKAAWACAHNAHREYADFFSKKENDVAC